MPIVLADVTTARRITWRRRVARSVFLAAGVSVVAGLGPVGDDAALVEGDELGVEAAPATEIPPSPRTAATEADAMVFVNLMASMSPGIVMAR
jgi:hypothetical protein